MWFFFFENDTENVGFAKVVNEGLTVDDDGVREWLTFALEKALESWNVAHVVEMTSIS